jgi:hypothetical protein
MHAGRATPSLYSMHATIYGAIYAFPTPVMMACSHMYGNAEMLSLILTASANCWSRGLQV